MKFDRFAGFDWDDGNAEKNLRKHGLSRQGIESFFGGPVEIRYDHAHSAAEERYFATGLGPDGKWMVVIFAVRKKGSKLLIRPISARPMHAKERVIYGKENPPF